MFKNRVRLPFYITRPQFPTEANIFRLTNGQTKTASVIIKKTFEGETENLPAVIHERLVIALRHDDVTIEGYRYLGGVELDGDYDIDWNKFLDYPLGKADFKVQVTPFNYSNDNCQTCEEISQIVCEDDDLGTIGEDETHSVPVLDNDSICCSPVIISLVTYNTDYLDSCIISGNEIIIHTKSTLPDATDVVLATYRAQCPNGQYDEANIIADIDGSEPSACLSPINIMLQDISETSATISWTQPSGALSYEWSLYLLSDLVTPIQTGTSDTADNNAILTGLTGGTQYRLYVRSVCDAGAYSDYVYIDFTTTQPPGNENCGQYELINNGIGFANVSYIDCNGNNQNIVIPTGQSRLICALQNSFADPVEIISEDNNVDISYIDLC